MKHRFFFFHDFSLWNILFLISDFHHVVNVVLFILGGSPRLLNFICRRFGTWNFVWSNFVGGVNKNNNWEPQLLLFFTPPMKMEHTECSETSAQKIRTPGYHPKEIIRIYIIIIIAFIFVIVIDVWSSGTYYAPRISSYKILKISLSLLFHKVL